MFRKFIVALVLAVVPMAGLVMTAESASAATSISACFKWDRGGAYAERPVPPRAVQRLEVGDHPLGQHQRVGVRQARQPADQRLRLVLRREEDELGSPDMGYAFYKSSINKWALPGTGGVNLGTFSVNLVQCTTGYYAYCAGLARRIGVVEHPADGTGRSCANWRPLSAFRVDVANGAEQADQVLDQQVVGLPRRPDRRLDSPDHTSGRGHAMAQAQAEQGQLKAGVDRLRRRAR